MPAMSSGSGAGGADGALGPGPDLPGQQSPPPDWPGQQLPPPDWLGWTGLGLLGAASPGGGAST
eukprot:9052799-Pyramimonas_sp.AAC.1